MIPVRLRLQGFLSYRQPQEVDFTLFDMACISGHNGAGKSSLLDAITWALFGVARAKSQDDVIHDQLDRAEVVLDFQYEEHLYRVQRARLRGKSTLLEFFVRAEDGTWRPLTESKIKDTEARIQRLLRMDYEAFVNASFFLQGKADQFTVKSPGERKAILMSILGLDVWDEFKEAAAARRREAEQEGAQIEGQIQEIERELAEEKERKAALAALEAQLQQAEALRRAREEVLVSAQKVAAALAEQQRMVETLREQWQKARQALENHLALVAERKAQWEAAQGLLTQAAEIEAAYAAWQVARQDLETWENLAARFHHLEAQRQALRQAIAIEQTRLESEYQTLEQQEREIRRLQVLLPTLEANLAAQRQKLDALEAHLAQRGALQRQKEAYTQEKAELEAENKLLTVQMNEIKVRIETLQAVSGATCPLCGQPLSPAERQRLIQNLQQEGKAMGDRFRANKSRLQVLSGEIQALDVQIRELDQVEQRVKAVTAQVAQEEERLDLVRRQIQDWQTTAAPRLTEVALALKEGRFAIEAREALAALDAQCRELGYDPAEHEAARQREQALRASEEVLRNLEKARAEVSSLEREIANLDAQREEREREVAALETQYREAEARYRRDAAELPDLDALEREVRDLKLRENQLRDEVGAARQKVQVLSQLKKRLDDLRVRRDEVRRMIARLKTLERAFSKDGVPALLIEQALPEIEAQANELLDRLSNGTMSVSFETQAEYKTKVGEKKETLDIIIRDGTGTRPYEMFSGGEAFRINFAIRLALARVLAMRAGARLQTLVIDEGFGSQDAEGRQRLVEALSLVRNDFAKILVITHLDELKDAFPARLEVEKTPSGSQIRLWMT
ncbi:SMC family ATPase [uncultured Thermanaerothrix sp.]|uniref:AAA family ATPase n=1 Tax=uncultured Thermanaerothrix sp. TaxID=1195149 RepID=UPI002632EF59|nr:SMC family ATPase [uncultured Thermanaerothrix sp.]